MEQIHRASRRALLGKHAGLGAVALLAACGGPTGGGSGEGGAAGQAGGAKAPVTLVQLSRRQGGTEAFGLQEKLVADYKAQVAPHVTIEVVPGTIPQEQLVVRAAGGDPVDFVENDWGTWIDLADGRVIEDLTPYFTRDKIDPNSFVGEALTTYSVQNKRYGLPVSMSVDGLFYNEDLFRAAGIAPPPQDAADRSWTMEKFLDTARRLTRGADQFGFGGAYNCFNTAGVTDGTYFGARAWDDARQKCLMDTDAFRRGVTYWLDAQHKQGIWPTADQANALRSSPNQNIFTTGKVAMQVACGVPPRSEIAFRWGVAALPYSGPAGSKNISGRMYPHGLHMGGASKAKDEIWAFFRWLARPENASRYPEVANHSVSPVKNGSDAIQKLRREQYGIDPKAFLVNAEGQIASGQGMLKYAAWKQVADELNPRYTNELKTQQLSVGEWVTTATQTIDRLLGKQ
jgi:ABC-type glycerol-3-phosphate transport system substrate-binding protein